MPQKIKSRVSDVILFRRLGNYSPKSGVGEQTVFFCCFSQASMSHTVRSMDVYILAVGVGESPLPRLYEASSEVASFF